MRSLIAIVASLSFCQVAFAVLPDGAMTVTTDFSLTNSRELWKGRDAEIVYQDAQGDTHPDGIVKTARTEFYNIGTAFSYGTGYWGIQSDFRIDITSSRMRHGTHPSEKHGGEDQGEDRISGIGFKLLKEVYGEEGLVLTPYFGYKHPGKSTPDAPTFLAVSDFSTHMDLGLKTQLELNEYIVTFVDTKYTLRSKQSGVGDGLPADQATIKWDLMNIYDSYLSFGAGLVYVHTMSGPDISSPGFAELKDKAGHPPFYAARERFLAHVTYVNYYLYSDFWVGLSHFEKFWGRNTDRSRTISAFAGWAL